MNNAHDIFETDLIEAYKGYNIRKDVTIKKFKVYAVINQKVLYGGSIDILKKKIDRELIHMNPRKVRDESTKHYPGFRGGAKRPTTEFRYIKVPGGRKHIKDEPGMSTFVKKKYNVTFMLYGRKKKQAVWAKDDDEAIAMIKDLYPGAGRPFKKNPRGAGIPIDQIQLDLMIEAHKSGKVFADSAKERKEMDRLVNADLMMVVSKANDVYNLTARGKKLLIEYLKEQEKYT